MDEDEDPVIQEIPVYLSQTLSKNLYVFQYPVKPAGVSWDDTTVLNCKIKPQHQEVKLEFGLDTDSERFCVSKAEQIALNTDGAHPSQLLREKDKEKCPYFRSGVMDRLQYESFPTVQDASKYAVAMLQEGQMHFTPINGIIQMRPSYSYYDKQEKRLREQSATDPDEEAAAGEAEATPVTVSFARAETERSKRARETSFNFLNRKSREEPWCDAMWCHSNSDKAELERSKLVSFACGMSPAGLSLPVSQYLSCLVPPDEEVAPVAPGAPQGLINLLELKKMSLQDQCKIVLKDAKVVTVGWLASVLGVSGAPLLAALSGAGRLLKGGRWAARSSLLYPPGTLSRDAGVTDTLMCRARDYVLYLFTQSQYVDRRKVTAAVKLPPEEVKEILCSVARLQTGKGWELLVPPDPEFSTKYPDVEQRQTLFWEARQRQFNEMLSGDPSTPKRQRKKSQRDSFSSDGMQSPKVRSNSVSNVNVNSDNESVSDAGKGKKCAKKSKTAAASASFNSNENRKVS